MSLTKEIFRLPQRKEIKIKFPNKRKMYSNENENIKKRKKKDNINENHNYNTKNETIIENKFFDDNSIEEITEMDMNSKKKVKENYNNIETSFDKENLRKTFDKTDEYYQKKKEKLIKITLTKKKIKEKIKFKEFLKNDYTLPKTRGKTQNWSYLLKNEFILY
jgi:hypothetical protein